MDFDSETLQYYIMKGKVMELKAEEKKGTLKKLVNVDFDNGKSPLNTAIYKKTSTIVTILIDNGADVNYIDGNGGLPLVNSANTNTFIIAPLLKAGAEVNKESTYGSTAFTKVLGDRDRKGEGLAVALISDKHFDITKEEFKPDMLLQQSIKNKWDRVTALILKTGFDFDYEDLRNVGDGTKKIIDKHLGLKKLGKYADLLGDI